jgi:hypothetical protein
MRPLLSLMQLLLLLLQCNFDAVKCTPAQPSKAPAEGMLVAPADVDALQLLRNTLSIHDWSADAPSCSWAGLKKRRKKNKRKQNSFHWTLTFFEKKKKKKKKKILCFTIRH